MGPLKLAVCVRASILVDNMQRNTTVAVELSGRNSGRFFLSFF